MSIYAWSDIHVDYPINLELIESMSHEQYGSDCLLVAGDVSDKLELIKRSLSHLKQTFAEVFFVPGNHDLWLRSKDFSCSTKKCEHILAMCEDIGVQTQPKKLKMEDDSEVWLVPLLSWYTRPEFGDDSLFIPKVGEDASLSMWMDTHRVKWNELQTDEDPADYFYQINAQNINLDFDAPVVSFSHFLPLKKLIFPEGVPEIDIIEPYENDPYPTFNFTRVAGSSKIMEQIEQIQSTVHYYGHQHRNRELKLNGTTYVSHCMGYPQEDPIGPTGEKRKPLKIWPAA